MSEFDWALELLSGVLSATVVRMEPVILNNAQRYNWKLLAKNRLRIILLGFQINNCYLFILVSEGKEEDK